MMEFRLQKRADRIRAMYHALMPAAAVVAAMGEREYQETVRGVRAQLAKHFKCSLWAVKAAILVSYTPGRKPGPEMERVTCPCCLQLVDGVKLPRSKLKNEEAILAAIAKQRIRETG